jgi:hypothetical protein
MRAKPASRAITKFEFVINLTTALGLTVPMQACLRSAMKFRLAWLRALTR